MHLGMLWAQARLFCTIVGVTFALFPSFGQATDACAGLFVSSVRATPSAVWISEMVELKNDIATSAEPLRAALADEWKRRFDALSPEDRTTLGLALRGQNQSQGTKVLEKERLVHEYRLEQANQLSFLPPAGRKAVVSGSFRFQDLRLGYSERDIAYAAHIVEGAAGVQWGSEGNFAAIRESNRNPRTLIVDLRKGTQRVIPGFGRLSVEGNLFVEVTSDENSRLHDLRSGATFEVAGRPAHDRHAVTENALITTVPNDRGRGHLFVYHDLSGPSPVSYKLGYRAVWGKERRYIATLIDRDLKIFDTRSLSFVAHPLAKRKISHLWFKDDLAEGFLEFSEWHGFPGFRREREMLLSLDDLKVHELDHRGHAWRPLAGTDLIYGVEDWSWSKQQLISLKSLKTGQEVAAHFLKQQPRHYPRDGETWIELDGELYIQDANTLKLTHYGSPPDLSSFHIDGLYLQKQENVMRLFDPKETKWFDIDLRGKFGEFVFQRDQDRFLVVRIDENHEHELVEIGTDGMPTYRLKSKYVQFSHDSKWMAIEVNGAIEIHRIAN